MGVPLENQTTKHEGLHHLRLSGCRCLCCLCVRPCSSCLQACSSLPRRDNVDISERPFQVVFEWYGSLICGGAWIGGNKVLTAAHCCDGSGASEVTVRAGTAKHASGGTVYDVAQVKMHPEYDSGTISNDACVLVLEKNIDDSNAKPVTLPPAGITFNKGEAMTVSGWGTTSQGGSLSSHLK